MSDEEIQGLPLALGHSIYVLHFVLVVQSLKISSPEESSSVKEEPESNMKIIHDGRSKILSKDMFAFFAPTHNTDSRHKIHAPPLDVPQIRKVFTRILRAL